MWQRIQTLFLFLAVITSIIEFLIFKNNIFIAATAGIISILTFFTIFLYKNRKMQIRFCIAIIILIICLFAFFIIVFYNVSEIFISLQQKEIINLLFLVISLIFIIFAKKFIKKDEKKVRSWERIR